MYRKTHQCGNDFKYPSQNTLFTSSFQDEQILYQKDSLVDRSSSIIDYDNAFVKELEKTDNLRFDPTNFSKLEDILLPQSDRFFSDIFWEFEDSSPKINLSNSEMSFGHISVRDLPGSNVIADAAHDPTHYQNPMDSILHETDDSFNDSVSFNHLLDNFCFNTSSLSNDVSQSDDLLDLRDCNNPIPYYRKASCPLDDHFPTITSPFAKKPGRKPKPLNLTEDEKSILKKEGVVLPDNVHTLTKTEERHIKQVKRRIKNKMSAAESRKRKKNYLDGLEDRVQQTTSLNCELQKRVSELEKRNLDLVTSVKRMRTFLTSYLPNIPKGNSALLLFVIAFSLFSIPSWISISNNLSDSHYSTQKLVNVGSRTLLTQSYSNTQWLTHSRISTYHLTRDNLQILSHIQSNGNIVYLKPQLNPVNKG